MNHTHMTHELKVDPIPFQAVFTHRKKTELRCYNDRDYQVGDYLFLRETVHTGAEMNDPVNPKSLTYTGRTCKFEVTHILFGPAYGLDDKWVLFSIEPISIWKRHKVDPISAAGEHLTIACHGASMNAGWWNDPITGLPLRIDQNTVAAKLMLIVFEVAEAMEGHRKGLMDDHLPDRPMIEVELADAVIRIADLCGALDLDLGGAIADKLKYNAKRADHKIENRKADGGKKY